MSSTMRRARLGALFIALLAVAALCYPAIRAFRSQLNQFKGFPHAVPKPAEHADKLVEVTFQGPGGIKVRGWYIRSTNGAAVICLHGSSADRRQQLNDALAFYKAGFGALIYDSPGHGESEGEIDWSEREYTTLQNAITWVEKQADVKPGHVAVYGFSMGGLVASMVAARDERVRALVSAAAPAELRRQAAFEFRRWGPLSMVPAQWALTVGGQDLDAPDPLDLIHKVSPRPVLIVTGDADPIVQPNLATELFQAAGEPKQLLVIPGGNHGSYLSNPAYHEKLVAFLTRTLLPAN